MNSIPLCFLGTTDPELARSVRGNLHGLAEIRHVADEDALLIGIKQFDPAALILDLRAPFAPRALADIDEFGLRTVVLGLAPANTIRALAGGAARLLFAGDTPEITAARLISFVQSADRHLRLLEDGAAWRGAAAGAPADRPEPTTSRRAPPHTLFRLADLAGVLRRFNEPDAMLDYMTEWIANCAMLSRVGVFVLSRKGDMYRFRSGLRHLPGTPEIAVPRNDPLPRWMQMQARVISRASAAGEPDSATRRMLNRALTETGAEVILPLYGRRSVIGWLFAGRHVTGRCFLDTDMEELTWLADLLSIVTENSLLYEEMTLQKTLAETVVQSIPDGIVVTGADGIVEHVNTAIGETLTLDTGRLVGDPVETLDGRLADILRRCLAGGNETQAEEWVYGPDRRTLSATARRLIHAGQCLGAVGIVRDMTVERRLVEQGKQQERAAYWAELVAAVSHEVRNPLVAINTFAQLLPERYDDREFRVKFSELVAQEIGRLNELLDQLQRFSDARELVLESADPAPILQSAIQRAAAQSGRPTVKTELRAARALPMVKCDSAALSDALSGLIGNALEAAPDGSSVNIAVDTPTGNGAGAQTMLTIRISDLGRGIPGDIRDRVFSPFFTTKNRGIGLGLPIARRIITEHGGGIDFQSELNGTTVLVSLPVAATERYCQKFNEK